MLVVWPIRPDHPGGCAVALRFFSFISEPSPIWPSLPLPPHIGALCSVADICSSFLRLCCSKHIRGPSYLFRAAPLLMFSSVCHCDAVLRLRNSKQCHRRSNAVRIQSSHNYAAADRTSADRFNSIAHQYSAVADQLRTGLCLRHVQAHPLSSKATLIFSSPLRCRSPRIGALFSTARIAIALPQPCKAVFSMPMRVPGFLRRPKPMPTLAVLCLRGSNLVVPFPLLIKTGQSQSCSVHFPCTALLGRAVFACAKSTLLRLSRADLGLPLPLPAQLISFPLPSLAVFAKAYPIVAAANRC